MLNQEINLSVETIQPKYSFLQSLGIPIDVLTIGVWIALTLFYSFTIGRRRGPVLLLSTYAGLAVTSILTTINLASVKFLQSSEFFGLGIFIFITVLAFVALVRTISRYITIHHTQQGVVLLGAFETGAFLSSIGFFLPLEMQNQLNGFSEFLFISPLAHVLWLFIPLLVLVIGEYGHRKE